MPKDYHKGKKIACYVPVELATALEMYASKYKITKTHIIVDALYSYIGPSARDSIEKALSDKHTN